MTGKMSSTHKTELTAANPGSLTPQKDSGVRVRGHFLRKRKCTLGKPLASHGFPGFAKELEKVIKEAPVESRQTLVKNLISGRLCGKLLPHNDRVSKGELTSSCMHLLESHRDQFYEALVKKEPKNLDIFLCYEESNACVGVKRKSFEGTKGTFTETDIDALLRDNKENVRIAQPIHAGPPVHTGDEL